jgi:hypothetical protein
MSVDSSLGSSNGGRPLSPVRKYGGPSVPCHACARGPCHSGCGIGTYVGRRCGDPPAVVCRVWTGSNF